MFFLLQHGEEAAHAAEAAHGAEPAAEHAEHVPIVVQMVNHYFGEWAYNFEMKYTYPKWKWLLAKFGSTPEAAFGAYTPENAIPWYTIMRLLRFDPRDTQRRFFPRATVQASSLHRQSVQHQKECFCH